MFNEKRPCKTVFFPYVTPEELMFLQIDYALDLFNKKAKITNEDQDYFRFLDNPTEFLQEVTGAEKIIPIHPSESSDIPIDSTIDFNKLSNHQTLTDNINISYNNDRTNPPKSFMLRFFHFSHKDLPCIQNYISYLSSLGINSWKDVFDPQNESTVSTMDLLDKFAGIKIPSQRKNATSLAMCGLNTKRVVNSFPTGIILTGDIELKSTKNYLRFIEHFKDQLPYVGFFLLPHHGSKGNLGPDFSENHFASHIAFLASIKKSNSNKVFQLPSSNLETLLSTEEESLVIVGNEESTPQRAFFSLNHPQFYFPRV